MLLTLVGEYHDRYIGKNKNKKKLGRMWEGEEGKEEKGRMGSGGKQEWEWGGEIKRGRRGGVGKWEVGREKKGKGEGNFNVEGAGEHSEWR